MAGLVGDAHRERAAGERRRDGRRLAQHVGRRLDALRCRAAASTSAPKTGWNGSTAGMNVFAPANVVQRDVVARQAEVGVLPGDTAGMWQSWQVETTSLVAAELRRVDAGRRVRARRPLVERRLLGEAGRRIGVGVSSARRARTRRSCRSRESGIAQVVARAAELGALRGTARRASSAGACGSLPRSAMMSNGPRSRSMRVDHHHRAAERRHRRRERGEDGGVLGGVLGRRRRDRPGGGRRRTARPGGRRRSSPCRPRAPSGPRASPSAGGSGGRSRPSAARPGSRSRARPT